MELNEHIRKLRSDYAHSELSEGGIENNPVLQFERWLKEAISAEVSEPNAMTLSTVSKEGKPSSRIVLLREISAKGFTFYSNYNSKKAQDIVSNSNAALNFFWPQVERQVRVEGVLEKISDELSDNYFQSRPRGSKLGAWASGQSQVIKSRQVLEEKFSELSAKFPGDEVPRPAFWGGYLLKPTMLEFWQGRPGRLHDRIQYLLKNHEWLIQRLSP